MNHLKTDATRTEVLQELLSTSRIPTKVTLFGTTEAAAQTELFIDHIDQYRIKPPAESVGYMQVVCTGYNVTDGTAIAPTVTTAQFTMLGTTLTVTQGTDVTNVYDDSVCQIIGNDTEDYITVNVTPPDADKTEWQVQVTLNAQMVGADLAYGAYDGITKG